MSRALQIKILFLLILVGWAVYRLVPTLQYWPMNRAERQALQLSDNTKFERLQRESIKRGLDLQGGVFLVLEVDPRQTMQSAELADAVEGARRVIEQRVNQYGVSEANVQKTGDRRLVVELPGLENIEAAMRLVGRTALLQFKLVRPVAERDEVLRRIDTDLPRVLGAAGVDTTKPAPVAPIDTVQQRRGPDSALFEPTPQAQAAAAARTRAPSGEAGEASLAGITSLSQLLESGPGNDLYVSPDSRPKVEAILDIIHRKAPELIPTMGEFVFGKAEDVSGRPTYPLYYVNVNAEMTGASVEDARVGQGSAYELEQAGRPVIDFTVKADSVRLFSDVTRRNRGERLAIVLDNVVYSAPVIQAHITNGRSVITGMEDREEARTLAIAIRSGALPAEVQVQEQRYVGPSLGADSIHSSQIAFIIGGGLVVLFMIAYYRVAGVISVVGLMINMTLLMAILASLHGTLTLPGVAGLVLTIGMAVDSNVLIFERIREEIRAGKTVRAAVEAGYERAASAIWDSNITTFITAAVLYQFGTGPIKGFALILGIGLFTSVFVALFVTRLIYDVLLVRRSVRELSIGRSLIYGTKFPFMSWRRAWFFISGGAVAFSILLMIFRGFNWGIDFAGGTRLEIRLDPPVQIAQIRGALSSVNVNGRRLDLGSSEIKTVDQATDVLITVKQFPNISAAAVDSALRVELANRFPASTHGNWVLNAESVGPKVGSELRTSAIYALGFSIIAMLIYLGVRFEPVYAVTSTMALFHDVLFTLGIFSLIRHEMTLAIVAALLTIIGYSLNDTIIVFDRVREGLRTYRRLGYEEVLDRSINETLSRTTITSGTTLFVVVSLLLLGGQVLRDFALALFIGIFVGTYSSVWVASALVLVWQKRQGRAEVGAARMGMAAAPPPLPAQRARTPKTSKTPKTPKA